MEFCRRRAQSRRLLKQNRDVDDEGRQPQNHLAENIRFAIALAGAPTLIKAKSNEENGNTQKVWPKGADVGRNKRGAACRSSSQHKRKHCETTRRRSQEASDC